MPQLASSPPQLKWHNTLPQHFSTQPIPKFISSPTCSLESSHVSPRHASGVPKAGDIKIEDESSISLEHVQIESPSSSNRLLELSLSASKTTTPVKLIAEVVPRSAGSLQTPPPTATKKRGRPPKTSQRRLGSPSKKTNVQSQNRQHLASQHDESTPRAVKPGKASERIEGKARSTISTPKRICTIAPVDDIFGSGSSFLDTDLALGWSTCGHTDYSGDLGADLFMRSDIGFNDPLESMALSFTCNGIGYEDRSSINPSLLFSSRPTSDSSSMYGGFLDETDINSSSSYSNEQPYQHQLEYCRREQSAGPRRTLKHKMKPTQRELARNTSNSSLIDIDSKLRRTISENVLADMTRERNSLATSYSNSGSRPGTSSTRSYGSSRQTPPPRIRSSVRLLISPSGRAKTETKVVYEDSETELDEPNHSPSMDESVESDHSLDEGFSHGSDPGEKPHVAANQARHARNISSNHSAPKLGFFSTAPVPVIAPIPTPTWPIGPETLALRSGHPLQSVQSTPKKQERRFLDECILSSPKLPTPLKNTPGSRPAMSYAADASFGGLEMDSRLSARPPFYMGDESEAETVVDEVEIMLDDDRAIKSDKVDKDDAVYALRSVVAKRRGLPIDSPSLSTPRRNTMKGPKRKRVKVSCSMNLEIGLSESTFRSKPHPAEHELDLFTGRPVTAPPKAMRRRKAVPNEAGGSFSNDNDTNGIVRSGAFPSITDYTERILNNETIRCVCGVNDDGGVVMVQCDSCKNWLHTGCAGLDTSQLPKHFKCKFCRGGILPFQPSVPVSSDQTSPFLPPQRKLF